MKSIEKMILKAIYDLSDEIDYNVYDADDIAEYLYLDYAVVKKCLESLYERGFLGECFSLGDEGIETYRLTNRALSVIN